MPAGRTHAAISKALLGDEGREVQRLIDSTAALRGPSHRSDPIHSTGGIAVALAMRGELTTGNVAHAAVHLATDRLWDEFGRLLPPGAPRRLAKQMLEDVTVKVLRGGRR